MKKLVILLLAFPLSSCVVIPVEETVSLLASGLSGISSSSPEDDTTCPLRYPLRSVCIEYNQDVAIPDFVPVIQNRFKKLQVESALYDPGNMPSSCTTVLRYAASRGWQNRFSYSAWRSTNSQDEKQSYLADAQLLLLQDGQVIASSRFMSDSIFDKWTSTGSKMNPVINDLVCKKN